MSVAIHEHPSRTKDKFCVLIFSYIHSGLDPGGHCSGDSVISSSVHFSGLLSWERANYACLFLYPSCLGNPRLGSHNLST